MLNQPLHKTALQKFSIISYPPKWLNTRPTLPYRTVDRFQPVLLLVLIKVLDYKFSTWETKIEGSWIWSQPWLHSTLHIVRPGNIKGLSQNKTSWKRISVVDRCPVCTKLWIQFSLLQMKKESPMIPCSSVITMIANS